MAPTYPPSISRRPSSVDTDSSTVSNIPPAGRDARASRSSSAYTAEPTHCNRGARAGLSAHPAGLSAHPAVTHAVTEAPARASVGWPACRFFVWEAPARVCMGGARAGAGGRPPCSYSAYPAEDPAGERGARARRPDANAHSARHGTRVANRKVVSRSWTHGQVPDVRSWETERCAFVSTFVVNPIQIRVREII